MADKNITSTQVDAHEQAPDSPETGLRSLGKKVGSKVQHTTGTILAGLALAISSPALAADTPVTPSTSANASADKGVGQRVTLKDGRVMSFVEIGKLQGKEKDTVIDGMSDTDYAKYEKYLNEAKQVANQRISEKKEIEQVANQHIFIIKDSLNQEVKNTEIQKEALNQMKTLYDLMDKLFTEQGVQVSENKEYKSQAIIARRVLDNPILTSKLTPDAINFLKNIEQSLSQGKNPFAYMSPEGKAKLRAIFKV